MKQFLLLHFFKGFIINFGDIYEDWNHGGQS